MRALCLLTLTLSCGDDPHTEASAAAFGLTTVVDAGTDAGTTAAESEVPPVLTSAGLEIWLAKRYFDGWHCDSEIRPSRSPGGTAPNRVCQNTIASAHGDGEYPVGSTNVREVFDASGTQRIGHAVTTKVRMGGGEAWYWYETRGVTISGSGLGDADASTRTCVACHSRANAALFGHDLVFNQLH